MREQRMSAVCCVQPVGCLEDLPPTDKAVLAEGCSSLCLRLTRSVQAFCGCPRVQFHPGDSVGCGKDHTLFALKSGIVVYKRNKYIKKVLCPAFQSQWSALRLACRRRLKES